MVMGDRKPETDTTQRIHPGRLREKETGLGKQGREDIIKKSQMQEDLKGEVIQTKKTTG